MQTIYQGIVTDENGELLDNMKTGLQVYIEKEDQDRPLLKEFKNEIYNPITDIARKDDPKDWPEKIRGKIKSLRRKQNLAPEIKTIFNEYYPRIKNALRIPIKGTIEKTTRYIIQKIDQSLPPPPSTPIEYELMNLDEVIRRLKKSKFIKGEVRLDQDPQHKDIQWLIINNVLGHDIKIPLAPNIYHKGGSARVILKLIFGDGRWLASEVPPKDFDILAYTSRQGEIFFEKIGEEDYSGIENLTTLERVFQTRDTDMNEAVFSPRGLHYTQAAKKAVETGIIKPGIGDHGIFGRDYFHVFCKFIGAVKRVLNGRSIERLIKTILEEKAWKFLIKKEWLQVFMGIFALVGSIRKIDKPGFAERLVKFYFLMEKMGQIPMFRHVFREKLNLPCRNFFEFYEGLHTLFPFVAWAPFGEDKGVARWLITKLLKLILQDFKERYHLFTGDMSWYRTDPSDEWIGIDMDDYVRDLIFIQQVEIWLLDFAQLCDIQTKYAEEKYIMTKTDLEMIKQLTPKFPALIAKLDLEKIKN